MLCVHGDTLSLVSSLDALHLQKAMGMVLDGPVVGKLGNERSKRYMAMYGMHYPKCHPRIHSGFECSLLLYCSIDKGQIVSIDVDDKGISATAAAAALEKLNELGSQ